MISALVTPLSDDPLLVYQEGGTVANLRLKIELNKGKRGISLDKLERIVQEMRRLEPVPQIRTGG